MRKSDYYILVFFYDRYLICAELVKQQRNESRSNPKKLIIISLLFGFSIYNNDHKVIWQSQKFQQFQQFQQFCVKEFHVKTQMKMKRKFIKKPIKEVADFWKK